MGVAVSNWKLARAVSTRGQLGVVSGTVLDTVFVRRLQDGDAGGHLRRAMKHFPIPGVAEAALHRYFRPAGRAPGERYKLLQMYELHGSPTSGTTDGLAFAALSAASNNSCRASACTAVAST